MNRKLRPLKSSQKKADLFLQLWQLETAGLAPDAALDIIKKSDNKIHTNISEFKRQINQGKMIAISGYNAKLFSYIDKTLISAGEVSGQVASIYKQLASHYAKLALHRKQLKSKMLLPSFIFIVFLFIQPLPALITGTMSIEHYLNITVMLLLKIAVLVFFILNLNKWLTTGFLKTLGLSQFIYKLQLNLPWFSSWLKTRQINGFFSHLGLLLKSGVSILDAVPIAIDTIANPVLRKKFKPITPLLNKGVSLAKSLDCIEDIDKQTIHQLVVAEQSGRLDETITHFTNIQSQTLAEQDQFIVTWIPRIIYFAIVVMVAYSLITTSSISSTPPNY